jgi:hypothetical protein
MKKPNLGDIFYFKNKIKIRYRYEDQIDEKHKHITCYGEVIVYEFTPGHKFKVIRVNRVDDFDITNLTTNDGIDFATREEILDNLITHKQFRELRLKELGI